MYDYQLHEAVYFRGTNVPKMSGRVYYADRTQRIVSSRRDHYANPRFVSEQTGVDFYVATLSLRFPRVSPRLRI